MTNEIFTDLATDDYLNQLTEESKKYEGLHVDMDDKEQRKFVKDKASLISGLLKKLERARIDKSKDYKAIVEKEANRIKEVLEVANKPFSILIDKHKEKRAKELADQKAIEDAKQLAIQIESDHGEAITLEKIRVFEIKEAIEKQKERDEAIASEARKQAELEKEQAEERAEQAEKDKILAEAQAKRDAEQAAENARIAQEQAVKRAEQAEKDRQTKEKEDAEKSRLKLEANKKHTGMVRGEIKNHLINSCGIDESTAKSIVLALLKTDRVTINY